MATIRKNQANLTQQEWQAFINAISGLRGLGKPTPRYGAFVDVHVRAMTAAGMSWGVHTMQGMVGRNFMAWHGGLFYALRRRFRELILWFPYLTGTQSRTRKSQVH